MRLLIIGLLTVLIGSTGAFAQPQQKQVPQGGRCTHETCVTRSMSAGWSSSDASQWCSKAENIRPWCAATGAMLAPAQIHSCYSPVESRSASGIGSML
jgi:hypothetical protein